MNKILFLCCFCLPLPKLEITSGYGYRIHPVTGKYAFHAGIDLRARSDTVKAILNGKVVTAGNDPLLGGFIRLSHGDFETIYGHLSQFFVQSGDSLLAGTAIGITGSTGRTTGEHLHFAVRYHHHYIDALKFLITIENQINQQNKEINK